MKVDGGFVVIPGFPDTADKKQVTEAEPQVSSPALPQDGFDSAATRSSAALTGAEAVAEPSYGAFPLKEKLISVIQHENRSNWPRRDRDEAIRALYNYNGDISNDQDKHLREIYRGGGSLEQFLHTLHYTY